MKRLVQLCTIFLICTIPAFGQGTQHDRIDARGYVKTDRFINRLFIPITGATPDVSLGNAFKTNNGSPVTITNLLNGLDTQEVDLLCGDANTTIQNNANISLTGGIDFTCVVNVGISFRYDASQTKWVQFGGTGSGGGGIPANVARKPALPNDPVQYVSANGNDANDGLSWGSAKLTVYAALQALPGGSTGVAGGGVVKISGTVAYGGPAANQGMNIMGGGDANFASPPSGWLKKLTSAPITIECDFPNLLGANSHTPNCLMTGGGTTDLVHPAIWISSTTGINTKNVALSNFLNTYVKIGIDSNNNRVLGGTSSITLDGLSWNHGACRFGGGPGIDIGDNSFWIWIRNPLGGGCPFGETVIAAPGTPGLSRSSNVVTVTTTTPNSVAAGSYITTQFTTDPSFIGSFVVASVTDSTHFSFNQTGPNATSGDGQVITSAKAAINIDAGSGVGSGLIFITDFGLNGGIIRLNPGASGGGVYVRNGTYEGDFSTPDAPPVLVIRESSITDVFVENLVVADQLSSTPIPGVRIDNASSQFAVISRVDAGVQGPATVLGGTPIYGGSNTSLKDLHAGFTKAGRVTGGGIDVDRRAFSPRAVPFVNLASTIPANWTLSGSGTITTGITAPDGTTNAGRLTAASGAVAFSFYTLNNTPVTIGDTYIWGLWQRSATTPGAGLQGPGTFILNGNGFGANDQCSTWNGGIATSSALALFRQTTGDGQWIWHSGICKVISNPANAGLNLNVVLFSPQIVDAFGPVVIKVPNGTASDNELFELATNLASFPDTASVGDVTMMRGQRFSMSTPGNNFFIKHVGTLTADRNVTWPDAAGTVMFTATPITLAQTPLTTNGDLLTVSGGVLARKAIGADGTFLGVASGAHSYIASSGTGSVCLTIGCALTTPTVATTLTMNAAAELRFTTTGGYAGIKAPGSVGTNLMWQLPAADAVGCFSSNGSFVMAIIACGGGGSGTPGGSPGNIQYNNTSFTGSPALNWDFTNNVLQVGNTGGALAKIQAFGNTSGSATIQAQAVAGTPTLLLPNTSGTFAVTASSPLVLNAVTGALTAPTVTTSAAPLANNQLAVGQSGQALATVGSLGTTTTVYHGNAAGVGAFNPIVDADFSGQLGFPHGGTGQATRQAAINALLDTTNDVTGDLFIFDGTNVTRLARGSNGACLTYTGVSPFIAPGSCASGAITGVGAVNALAIWSTTSSLTQSPNLTYVPAVGLSLTQGANGSDTFLMLRATDSSPTGTYFRGRNAINTLDTFRIDTLGNIFGTSFTGVGPAAGFYGIGQGTAQSIVANTAGFTGPTSITGYNISVPAAAGTGVWRLTNAANVMTSTIVAASGVGSCTPANNVVVALNDNAAPQCSTVAGPMFGTQSANLVFKGPNSGVPAFPTFAALVSADLPPINLNTNGSNGGVTAVLGFINGGCNATSASACLNNISPMTTLGDTIYGGTVGAATRLAGNITATKQYLSQTGTGSVSAAPAWAQIAFADLSGVCTIAQGCSGQTTANAALNAFLPAQGGNAGKVLGTDGANTTWVVGGGGGGGTPAPNYGTAFSSQTSITITGVTHNLGTKNLLLACYDTSSPARAIQPASWTIDGSTFDVVVNFAVSQSGYCAVNGSGPNRYAATFGSTSSLVVTGATHKLATADITVTIWDSASGTRHIIQPASVSIDSTTFDVTVIFATSQSGRIVLE